MPGLLAYRTYRLFWQGLDWLYPPSCAGCGQKGRIWCDACSKDIIPVSPPICPRCGEPQRYDRICNSCRENPPRYIALRSWAVFQGELREAIHQLKYRRNVSLGQVLAQPMIEQLCMLDWPIDLVTPVPLGLVRMAERGYNQASLLARPIAMYLQKMYRPGIIHRCKETRSQVGLPLSLRKENMKDAFSAESTLIRGKNVLVIDDVITSGATMNACAKALVEAGAEKVYGYSLARGGIKSAQKPGKET